jgi:hypothetical protein
LSINPSKPGYHTCNVCTSEYSEDEGGVEGYFGILPVQFCPTCFASMIDMAQQYLIEQNIDSIEKNS